MRKADYALLAAKLREDIENVSSVPALGQTVREWQLQQYAVVHATRQARYFASVLAVDRQAFLNACGLRQ